MSVKGFGVEEGGACGWHTDLITFLCRVINRKEIRISGSVIPELQTKSVTCIATQQVILCSLPGLNPVPKKFISTQVSELQIFNVLNVAIVGYHHNT